MNEILKQIDALYRDLFNFLHVPRGGNGPESATWPDGTIRYTCKGLSEKREFPFDSAKFHALLRALAETSQEARKNA